MADRYCFCYGYGKKFLDGDGWETPHYISFIIIMFAEIALIDGHLYGEVWRISQVYTRLLIKY